MKFYIENMNCGGCARSVTSVIQNVDSSAKVEAHLASKVITIETTASSDDITSALIKKGFIIKSQ